MKHTDAIAALERQIDRAQAALRAERFWPLVLIPLAALALWLTLALVGAQAALPPLAASLAAIAALLGVFILAGLALARWRKPSRLEARARLERDARLDPGSLAALEDQPAKLDPVGLAMWGRAQKAAAAAAMAARARPGQINWAKADRLKLRFVAPIALGLGLLVAGQNAPDRLAQALLPDPGPLLGDQALQIEGWLAPAAYTGAAPIGLSDRIGQTIDSPPSVEATVRVSGPVGAPLLRFRGKGGEREVKFERQADGAWEAKLTLPGPGRIELVRFHTKARWWVRPAPDAAPSALFVEAPKVVKDRVQFAWEGRDDFGVRAAYLELTPVNPPQGLVGAAPERTTLESPADEPKLANAKADLDLRPHPLAGMEVEARIVVRDATGQEGKSNPIKLKLPEQLFLQPLAQAAVEIRKNILHERRPYAPMPKLPADNEPASLRFPDPLLGYVDVVIRTDDQSPRLERAPAGIHRAVRMLDALTIAPQDGYFNDAALFMGFKLARATLTGAKDLAQADVAADLLWDAALRAEYGDSASAKRAMEMAQKALSEALNRGATPDEIERLTQALREATERYMQAMVQEAIREGRYAETEEDSQAREQALNQNTIDEMMKEIERLAKEGRTEEANQLLQQLAQLMQNMQIQLAKGQQGEGGGPNDQNKMTKEMDELSEALGEQRALRDDTQSAQNGQQPGQEQQQQQSQSSEELANRQEKLQRQMEGVSKGLKDKGGEGENSAGGREAGEQLDRAGEAMRQAERALRRNDLEGAQRAQDDALRQMRAAGEALSRDQMNKNQQAKTEAEEGPQQRDPLGRKIGGLGAEGDDVTVPESVQRERAREILDELRRRAQDPRRPESEREYLRRLLDRFSGGS